MSDEIQRNKAIYEWVRALRLQGFSWSEIRDLALDTPWPRKAVELLIDVNKDEEAVA